MKNTDLELLKRVSELDWKTKSFKLKDDSCGRKSIYEEGDVFQFDISADKSLGKITLLKDCLDKGLEVPFFLTIKPTWFVRENILYATFIVGNDPCELHRFIIWFENLNSDNPCFHFEIIPLYDDCVCDELNNRVMFMSGHGIGDGTGENK